MPYQLILKANHKILSINLALVNYIKINSLLVFYLNLIFT